MDNKKCALLQNLKLMQVTKILTLELTKKCNSIFTIFYILCKFQQYLSKKVVHGQNVSGQNVSAKKNIGDKTHQRQNISTTKRIGDKTYQRQNMSAKKRIARQNVSADLKKVINKIQTFLHR